MKYFRRYGFWALAALIVMGGTLIIFTIIFGGGKDKNGTKDNHYKRMQEACDSVNSRNLDIMVYGKDFAPPENFKYRTVTGFDDYSLALGTDGHSNCSAHMLVINDPNNELFITQDQWTQIKSLLDMNNFYLVVLGDKFGIMSAVGIIDTLPTAGTRSTIIWNGGKGERPGFADNPELVPFYVEQDMPNKDEQLLAYTMIMELSTHDLYFN